ncbi:hypothetical protein EVAR_24882_1 [Eumeta japonica]|uniref:Uncharacterized protein n=1 Tax=Eumeta variegata TaxID=151549 RepID=A0A4C1V571_EUMVA|nr:hypothetical protein EVAR_24882_1 [Eumeta japonica]
MISRTRHPADAAPTHTAADTTHRRHQNSAAEEATRLMLAAFTGARRSPLGAETRVSVTKYCPCRSYGAETTRSEFDRLSRLRHSTTQDENCADDDCAFFIPYKMFGRLFIG